MKRESFGVLNAVVFAMLFPFHALRAEASHTTICTVARSPESFNAKRIEVRARIESDGFEWFLVLDDSCPTYGMNLTYEKSFSKTAIPTEITKLVFGTGQGTKYLDIRGMFIGKVVWRPNELDHHLRLGLVVDGIKNMTVRVREKERLSPFLELR